jgi:hypothetical protein
VKVILNVSAIGIMAKAKKLNVPIKIKNPQNLLGRRKNKTTIIAMMLAKDNNRGMDLVLSLTIPQRGWVMSNTRGPTEVNKPISAPLKWIRLKKRVI